MDTQTLLSIIAILAAISIPFVIFYLGNKKKKLIFEELQNLSVVDIKTSFKDKIEIQYSGKTVDNLFVSTATIINKGRLPIKKSDIIKPIESSFNKEVIDCNVIEVNPEGIDVSPIIGQGGKSIECEFDLLNPKDYFTLQFVSLEKLGTPNIISRIEGLSKIEIVSNTYQKGNGLLSLASDSISLIIYLIVFIISLIFMIYTIWKSLSTILLGFLG